jgi:hypothetical protein
MKRSLWMGLPLALVLGCHHNLNTSPHSHQPAEADAAAVTSAMRRFPNVRSQIAFVAPVGMKVGWETSMGAGQRTFMPAQLTVPGRYNFEQGAIYRLKITEVASHPGVPFYPTLEVAPSSSRTDPYLTHNAIPIEFTDEDFDQVSSGNFVSKVIYLPDPQHQELAIAGVETLVSTRLDPGVDPIAEADRRGTILAIVRLGGIDLEMPQAQPIAPAAPGMPPDNFVPVPGPGVQPASFGQYGMHPMYPMQPMYPMHPMMPRQ